MSTKVSTVTMTVFSPVFADAGAVRSLALHAPVPNTAQSWVLPAIELVEAAPVRISCHDALRAEGEFPVANRRQAVANPVGLDARALAPGVYLDHVESGSEMAWQRFTVVR